MLDSGGDGGGKGEFFHLICTRKQNEYLNDDVE